jgi:hypothetical protein
MKHLAFVGLVLAGLLAGCNKPSEDACKKAILNIKHLHNTENVNGETDLDGEVRRCRGGSTRESVECAGSAQTLEDLNRCAFNKEKGEGGDK